MEEGSRLARAMHEAEPEIEIQEDWADGQRAGSEPTVAPVKSPAKPSRLPMVIGGVALLAALAVAGSVGVLVLSQDPPQTITTTEVVSASPSIVLRISPVEGVVKIDGKEAGKGSTLTVPDLSVGKHRVEVSADGHEPFAEDVDVGEGEKVRLDVKLVPVRKSPEVRVESPSKFSSNEAAVRVGPKVDAKAAEMETKAELPPPPPAEKPKGKVSINVSGTWADIYVDGKKIGTTPISGYQLPAGTYAVRAKNDAVGLDATKQVTVKAGESSSVSFAAQ
jgi:hypothetical protein